MFIPQQQLLIKLEKPQFIDGETYEKGTTVLMSLVQANTYIRQGIGSLVTNIHGYNTESDDYGDSVEPLESVLLR